MNLVRIRVTQGELDRGEGNQDFCEKLKNKTQINITLLMGYKHLDFGGRLSNDSKTCDSLLSCRLMRMSWHQKTSIWNYVYQIKESLTQSSL